MRFASSLLTAFLLGAMPARAQTGEMIFNDICSGCHQVGTTGVPGEYPRLAGRANKIAADPKGRVFLTQLVLTGMSGAITVDGNHILGLMPNFDAMSDEDLAAALNYVTGLEGRKSPVFSPLDIKSARIMPKATPEEMAQTRNRLSDAHIIP
jgi:mono/diheme cytochrome c family protein